MRNILLSLLVLFQSLITSATVYHTTDEPDASLFLYRNQHTFHKNNSN